MRSFLQTRRYPNFFILGIAVVVVALTGEVSFAAEVRRIDGTASMSVFVDANAFGTAIEFSPIDSTLIAVSSRANELSLVDIGGMAVQWRVTTGFNSRAPAVFSHDGRVVALGNGPDISFVDVYSGVQLQRFPITITPYAPPHPYPIGALNLVRWSRDDRTILAVSSSAFVLADRATGGAVQVFELPDQGVLFNSVKDIQFSDDERSAFLLTSTHFYVFNVASGVLMRTVNILDILPPNPARQLGAMRITLDGAYTVVSERLHLFIIDNQSQQLVRRILAASAPIGDVGFTGDQCCVMTASQDGTSRLYEIATGEQLTRLDDTRPANERVSLSAVGSPKKQDVIVSADFSGLVRVWRP